jgi:PAS domain S-box-containing protein
MQTDVNGELIPSAELSLKALFNTVLDSIIVINSRGVIVEFNKATLNIFGYEAGELYGRNVSMLMPEPDRGHHDQYIQNYENTGKKKIIGIGREVTAVKKDGTEFPARLGINHFMEQGLHFYVGTIQDITEEYIKAKPDYEKIKILKSNLNEKDYKNLDKDDPLRIVLDQILSEDDDIKEDISIDMKTGKINEDFPPYHGGSWGPSTDKDLDFFDDDEDGSGEESDFLNKDEVEVVGYTKQEDNEVDDNDEVEETENIEDEDIVSFFNDKDEDFRCELSVEGVNISKCKVRLNLETKEWNLYFNGKIDRKGNCEINVPKLSILSEGTKGMAILEILADDTVFIPWETEFLVKKSKKVTVKINDSKGKKGSKIKLKRIV